MDAPPEKEDCEPFVQKALALAELDVHTPHVYRHDFDQGFIVLEDFGNIDYLDQLDDFVRAQELYGAAINALLKIQTGPPEQMPAYSQTKLREEMSLFPAWFLRRYLNITMSDEQAQVWQATQDLLCRVCAEQPQVWVHRDYHSRNLMVTESNSPGVIDFQDMVTGPIAYDLASIFKDCYIEWPREQQLTWLTQYYRQLSSPNFSYEQLIIWYDLTGLQRHLKVLGIFCRLNFRDGKARYLSDLPLAAKYCIEVLNLYSDQFSELAKFRAAFATAIAAATK